MEDMFGFLFKLYLLKKPDIIYNIKYNNTNYNMVLNDWSRYKKGNTNTDFILKYPYLSAIFEQHKNNDNHIILYHSKNNDYLMVMACLNKRRINTIIPYMVHSEKLLKIKHLNFLAIYQ